MRIIKYIYRPLYSLNRQYRFFNKFCCNLIIAKEIKNSLILLFHNNFHYIYKAITQIKAYLINYLIKKNFQTNDQQDCEGFFTFFQQREIQNQSNNVQQNSDLNMDQNGIIKILDTKHNRGNIYLGSNQMITQLNIEQYKIGAVLSTIQQNHLNDIQILQITITQKIMDISDQLKQSYKFIQDNIIKANILICCEDGIKTSPAILIGYIMLQRNCEFDFASEYVQKRKPDIDINSYQKQLENFYTKFISPRQHTKNTYDLIYKSNDKNKGNLFLGALSSIDSISQLNIVGVVSILDDFKPKISVNHYYSKYGDHPRVPIINIFEETYQFIDENLKNGNVLVHCMSGRSRSATIVIAYLMRSQKMRVYEAIISVQEKRPLINPNDGFIQQLYSFDVLLFGE
ncbi:tyrosine protein phosphatase yvh1 [Paramecium bursaria]